MFQVRIHGRGGQGIVTAAELLALAAFREGRHAQLNTSRSFDELGLEEFVQGFRSERATTVPATEIAREHLGLGRPLPNAVLLGAFAALTGSLSLDAIAGAIREKFNGRLAEGNVAGTEAAFAYVRERLGVRAAG